MSKAIAADVFDFVDELVGGLSNVSPGTSEFADQDALALTFCESLFDQFFATISLNITGFGQGSKRRAAIRAEELRHDDHQAHVRRMIVYYEQLCDNYLDIKSDYGGEAVSDIQTSFHTEYIAELLDASQAWAVAEGHAALATRIERAVVDYNDAVGATRW